MFVLRIVRKQAQHKEADIGDPLVKTEPVFIFHHLSETHEVLDIHVIEANRFPKPFLYPE
jgi:hypothetical protein